MSTAAHDGEAPLPRLIPLRSMTKQEPNTGGGGTHEGTHMVTVFPRCCPGLVCLGGGIIFFFFDWEFLYLGVPYLS